MFEQKYTSIGSGKTFTMDGVKTAIGIIPRTIDSLYESFQQNEQFGWKYTITASSLEIYEKKLCDLLSSDSSKQLNVQMTIGSVANLSEHSIKNKEELQRLILNAKLKRKTASTAGNENSSRSHSMTQLRLTAENEAKNETTKSSIWLVDLAGSEKPKTVQEGVQSINLCSISVTVA